MPQLILPHFFYRFCLCVLLSFCLFFVVVLLLLLLFFFFVFFFFCLHLLSFFLFHCTFFLFFFHQVCLNIILIILAKYANVCYEQCVCVRTLSLLIFAGVQIQWMHSIFFSTHSVSLFSNYSDVYQKVRKDIAVLNFINSHCLVW